MKVIGEIAYKAAIARDSMNHFDDIAGGLLYDVPCPSASTTSSSNLPFLRSEAKNAGIDLASRKSCKSRGRAR